MFFVAIESDYDILKLFYSTPIVDIAQRLLGMFGVTFRIWVYKICP